MNEENKLTLCRIEDNISWLRSNILNKYELDAMCSDSLDELLSHTKDVCLLLSKEAMSDIDVHEMSYLDFEELDIDYIDRIGGDNE